MSLPFKIATKILYILFSSCVLNAHSFSSLLLELVILTALLYSSPSIVRVIKARRMRLAGHVARMGVVRGAYNMLVGRPEGRRPLGRPRRRWEDNIKMYLGEIGFGDVDWIHWAQDTDRWRAVVNTVMSLRVL
jgi:hypothetical protein